MTKPITLIFLSLLFMAMATHAQPAIPKDVKPLYRLLAASKADTGRVNILISMGRYDNGNSARQPNLPDSALAMADRARSLSEKLNYPEGIGLSYQVMAQAWCNKKNYKKSDELIKKALSVFLDHGLLRDAAEAYLNMEEFYLSAGGKDYLVMIGYYEQAAPLFHKAGAFDREGATLSMLGDFYQVITRLDEAQDRLDRAIIAFKKIGYNKLQATYDLLGSVFMKRSQYQQALSYGILAERTALAVNDTSLLMCTIYCRLGSTYFLINKVEQADKYFHKALVVAEKYKDRPSIRIVMQSLFAVLANERKYPDALALLRTTVKKYPSADPDEIIMTYANYIRAYSGMKNYKMADRYADTLLQTGVLTQGSSTMVYALSELTEYLIKSHQYARAANYTTLLKEASTRLSMRRNQYKAYLFMFKIDSAQKRYVSAIENYRRYFFIKDSLYDLSKTKQLEELKIKYETDKNEQSIASLQKDSLLQHERVKQADHIRNLTVVALVVVLVFIALLYNSYSINKQNSKAIAGKNDELKQLINEKEWLLKEIHHRVKNNLQIVTGLLQRQSAYIDNNEALAAIQNSENRMHAIALIHQKLYQSESLDLISMPEYIEEMISFLKDSCGLDHRIIFEKHLEDIRLDVAQAVPLGLILNEAITNAIKYAYKPDEKGTIYITLVKNEDGLDQLTIADNGTGMPPDLDLEKVDSLGLNLIRGLVKQLGGKLEFSNEMGCTINIIFKTEFFSKTVGHE